MWSGESQNAPYRVWWRRFKKNNTSVSLIWVGSLNGTSALINQFSVFCRKYNAFHVEHTLGILIQEFIIFVPTQMFQMKTPKTLERHIWIIDINAAFQEILIYLMFDPRFSRFSPSGSCHLGRWPPAGRAACLPPSGPEGLSRPHVQVHCVDPMCKLNPPPPESSQRHLLYASGILRYFFFF